MSDPATVDPRGVCEIAACYRAGFARFNLSVKECGRTEPLADAMR
jgi:hypothetical protein